MKLPFYCLIIALLFAFACNPSSSTSPAEQSSDPFETALPHGSSLPNEALSLADQQKLENAYGRTVDTLSIEQLRLKIDSLNQGLSIISFWRLDCQECKLINQYLTQLASEGTESPFSLTFVNLDDLEYLSQVNASIREQGIISDCYILHQDNQLNWEGMVQSNWEGSLPALVLLNPSEGIHLFYQKAFSQEELQALIQPFML